MEDDFEFEFSEDPKFSVERYEEMIRNQDQYFFDAQAFENIIDYYIEKNDPIKALQNFDLQNQELLLFQTMRLQVLHPV